MRAIITMMLVLFCTIAFSQTYTFQRNDFRLEILRGTQIRSSMLLEDVRWVERNAGETISVFDGVHSFTVNASQIGNYASNQIDSLIIDLEAWRLLAITRVSGDTLFIGNDTLIITAPGAELDSFYNDGTSAWLTNGDTIQGYLTAEVDSSITNELDSIYHVDGAKWLLNGDTIAAFVEVDGSTTNELDSIYDANQSVWLLNGDTIQAIVAGGGFTDTATVEVITLRQDTSSLPWATADFVFGSPSLDDDGDPNHDYRMFFDKSTGAFRAGGTDRASWDVASRGARSFASGWINVASGYNSVAMGSNCTASNTSAIALGTTSTASGIYSVALAQATASNNYAIAMGTVPVASGRQTLAAGSYVQSPSFSEASFGMYNTTYTPLSANSWNSNDRILSVGNSSTSSPRSDAFTIIKNGKIGIGIDNFEASDDGGQILHVNGSIKVMQVDTLPLGDDTLTTANYHVIKMDANASSADTIYLPDLSAGDEGTTFIIVDGSYNAATNPFVVAALPSGDDTINNTTNVPINSNGGYLTVFWALNNYYIREN